MKPLSPAEAADLARVITHPRGSELLSPSPLFPVWTIRLGKFRDVTIERRTLRACIKAAVRWCEEQGT